MTVLAAGMWVVFALAVAVTTMSLYSRVGTDEAAFRAAASEGEGSDDGLPEGGTFVRTELYFGTQKQSAEVTKEQFDRFVGGASPPRFPDGSSGGRDGCPVFSP
jgi:hypothetical protein